MSLIVPLFHLLSENPSDTVKLEDSKFSYLTQRDTRRRGQDPNPQESMTAAPAPGNAIKGVDSLGLLKKGDLPLSRRAIEKLRSEVEHIVKDHRLEQ